MSQVRIYQNSGIIKPGPAKTTPPKYKIGLDGQELEFTDEEVDEAWSEALKEILKQGGANASELDKTYSVFKEQMRNGKYNFDVAQSPSQTLSGSYDGGDAMLGTDKKTRIIHRIFGLNEPRKMNEINREFPMQLKRVADTKAAKLKQESDELAAKDKEKLEKEKKAKYAGIAAGHGFGVLAFGQDYTDALSDPTGRLKSILDLAYWNKNESERRDLLTRSGSGLSDIQNLNPDELKEIEESYPGFTKRREDMLKFYDSNTKQFNFSNLPKFDDLYQYSNAQNSMEQDRYLFDQNATTLPKSQAEADAEAEEQQKAAEKLLEENQTQQNDRVGEVMSKETPTETNYQKILRNRTSIDVDPQNLQDNSLIRQLFEDKYKPGEQTLQLIGSTEAYDVYLTEARNPDGSVKLENEMPVFKVVSINKADGSKEEREVTPDDINSWDSIDFSKLEKYNKNLKEHITVASGGSPTPVNGVMKNLNEYFNFWAKGGFYNPENYKEGGIIKAQNGTTIKRPAIKEGYSSTVGNITEDGLSQLSSTDMADLITLGLDLTALTPTGPVAQGAGILGGLTGMYADIQRDGFQPMDQVYGLTNTAIGAQSFIPGIGQLKSQKIAKNVMKLKKVLPAVQVQLTGMGMQGAATILNKVIENGFENLTLEDMRMLGGALAGLKNAKQLGKKLSPYEKVSLGESRVIPVEFTNSQGKKITHRVVLTPEEVQRMNNPQDGSSQQAVARSIVFEKLNTDANLKGRVGDISINNIEIPTKTSFNNKLKFWNPAGKNNLVDAEQTAIQIKAPTDKTGLSAKVKELYNGNSNENQYAARNIIERGQQTIPNQDVTLQRLQFDPKTKTLEMAPGTVEVNAKNPKELKLKQTEYNDKLKRVQDLEKSKPEVGLEKLRKAKIQKEEIDKVEAKKMLEPALKELAEVKALTKKLKSDPEMQKNLESLIKDQTIKLQKLRSSMMTNKGPSSRYGESSMYGKSSIYGERSILGPKSQFPDSNVIKSKSPALKSNFNNADVKISRSKNSKVKTGEKTKPTPQNTKTKNNKSTFINKTKAVRKTNIRKREDGGILLQNNGAVLKFQGGKSLKDLMKLSYLDQANTNTNAFTDISELKQRAFDSSKMNLSNPDKVFIGNKNPSLPKLTIDPVWGLKTLEQQLASRTAKNQDINVSVPLAQQVKLQMPTVSGSLLYERSVADKVNAQRVQGNQNQTSDGMLNKVNQLALNSNLQQYENEAGFKGQLMRRELEDKRLNISNLQQQSDQQVQNLNLSANATKLQGERDRKNARNTYQTEPWLKLFQNKAEHVQAQQTKGEAYQQALSKLQLSKEIDSNPKIQENISRFEELSSIMPSNLTEEQKTELLQLKKWYSGLIDQQTNQLYTSFQSGQPYKAGTFKYE